ncbi:hypothetical protein JCM19237_4738 [Photobacterium aphoticum]|uniref:Uncharacterized protein n=1 Tax=Photobacterium aphoticum TaxID=754436 RepID=A0A090QR62_9GAMM|nr:hypothetical protein JCM19237_4738 [Photobacterium aphoticum]
MAFLARMPQGGGGAGKGIKEVGFLCEIINVCGWGGHCESLILHYSGKYIPKRGEDARLSGRERDHLPRLFGDKATATVASAKMACNKVYIPKST